MSRLFPTGRYHRQELGSRLLLLVVLASAGLIVGACGGSSAPKQKASTAATTTVTKTQTVTKSTTAASSTATGPLAHLSTQTTDQLLTPENQIIQLATDTDLSAAGKLIAEIRQAPTSGRAALLKELAAADAACVSYNNFGEPSAINTQYCPAATLAPVAQRHAEATRAVSQIIAVLKRVDITPATVIPNSTGFHLTVGSSLADDIRQLQRAGFPDQATRLRAFETGLSAHGTPATGATTTPSPSPPVATQTTTSSASPSTPTSTTTTPAPITTACSGGFDEDGSTGAFWEHIQASGISCAEATPIVREWVITQYGDSQTAPYTVPNVLVVNGFSCSMADAGQATDVTCVDDGQSIRFVGSP